MVNNSSIDFIQTLWDELADYAAAAQQPALDHLMEGLCSLVDAQNALWLAAVRMSSIHSQDPLKDWRIYATYHLWPNPDFEQRFAEIADEIERHDVGLIASRLAAGIGGYRSNRLCDLADTEWFESDAYRTTYLARDVSDAIWACCPVSADAEVLFCVQRHVGKPPFTEKERNLVGEMLRGLKWFHRQQMLGHGLLNATSPLTDTERRVLEYLLSGESEKRIADALDQSYHTTHQHIKNIYRKFGVNNRAKLTSLWLGRAA